MIIIALYTRAASHSHFANGLAGFDSLAAAVAVTVVVVGDQTQHYVHLSLKNCDRLGPRRHGSVPRVLKFSAQR